MGIAQGAAEKFLLAKNFWEIFTNRNEYLYVVIANSRPHFLGSALLPLQLVRSLFIAYGLVRFVVYLPRTRMWSVMPKLYIERDAELWFPRRCIKEEWRRMLSPAIQSCGATNCPSTCPLFCILFCGWEEWVRTQGLLLCAVFGKSLNKKNLSCALVATQGLLTIRPTYFGAFQWPAHLCSLLRMHLRFSSQTGLLLGRILVLLLILLQRSVEQGFPSGVATGEFYRHD